MQVLEQKEIFVLYCYHLGGWGGGFNNTFNVYDHQGMLSDLLYSVCTCMYIYFSIALTMSPEYW